MFRYFKGKKVALMLTAAILITTISSNGVLAEEPKANGEEIFYTKSAEEDCVEVQTQADVTEEMCSYSYWPQKSAGDAYSLMMDITAIESLNAAAIGSSGTNMHDLTNVEEMYNAKNLVSSLVNSITTSKKALYVNQESVSANDYYKSLQKDVADTAYTEESRKVQYAVAVKQTEINTIPSNAYVGYYVDDTDNEIVNSALSVNEPFIVKQRCISKGHTFYWGFSDSCTGWVDGDAIAFCSDKAQWLDSWQVDSSKNDFVVVTQDKIVLEPSYYTPDISEVKLTIGTVLKEVPEDQIPSVIDNRGKWNNYIVYLPVRDADGKYQKRIALISQHYNVSEGYLPMTKENILKVAFSCLGNRYGWGGMMDLMDCSLYTRNVYRCFGARIPRNTTWQQEIPDTKISFDGMSDEAKAECIKKLPAGTLLYFNGHTMIYIGYENDKMYVLSALGSVVESTGEVAVQQMYSVALNSLDVRRKSGTTWLDNLRSAVCPFGIKDWPSGDEESDDEEHEKKESENKSDEHPEQEKLPRLVTPLNGEIYAAANDTLLMDAFYNKTNKLYVDFSRIDRNRVQDGRLQATVIAGSRVYTKEAVSSITCEKNVGKASISKKTGIAAVRLKASGDVTYKLNDGSEYVVHYEVEKPKANKEYKSLAKGDGIRTFTVSALFGTAIDAGRLEIASDKNDIAAVSDNVLRVDTTKTGSIKVVYMFLNKKYKMKIKVK